MNRQHIRDAQKQLENASRVFYRDSERRALREHLIKAIRHITKVILGTR